MRASVVIPSFNRCEHLKLTLGALAQQTARPNEYEVIVVDDGSTDETINYLHRLVVPYPFRFLQQSSFGPGAARNRGTTLAKANLFIFLDADMISSQDLVQQYLETYRSHQRAIIIGRQIPWRNAYSPEYAQICYASLVYDLGAEHIKPPFHALASGNFAIDRHSFESLGGFDERLKMAEDVDLGYRAREVGIEIIYDPTCIAYHNHPKTLQQIYTQTQTSAWWTAQLMHKNPGIIGHIPVFQSVEPIQLRRDSRRGVMRKLVTSLNGSPVLIFGLKLLFRITKMLPIGSRVPRYIHFKILTGYRFRGFRQGLRSLQS